MTTICDSARRQSGKTIRLSPSRVAENLAQGHLSAESKIERGPRLILGKLVLSPIVASRESQRPAMVGRRIDAPVCPPHSVSPGLGPVSSQCRPGIPTGGSCHSAGILQEGARV